MAQSSNYKQYNRGTRVLTEESGFAGGMYCTGNNIDETHLKTIVNFDYDDTTGYLKTRDPIIDTADTPTESDVGENGNLKDLDLTDYRLLGVYNICAVDSVSNTYLEPGLLYVFAKPVLTDCIWYTPVGVVNEDNEVVSELKCVFKTNTGTYFECYVNCTTVCTLQNLNLKNSLMLYDNQLYGITKPESITDTPWLQVFTLYHYDFGNGNISYMLAQASSTDTFNKINSVSLLEAGVSGFNAARGKDTFLYSAVETTGDSTTQYYSIDGLTIHDTIINAEGKEVINNITISPKIGQTYVLRIPTHYKSSDKDYTANTYIGCVALYVYDTESESWRYIDRESLPETKANRYGCATGEYAFKYEFKQKQTTFLVAHFGSTNITEAPPLPYEKYIDKAIDVFNYTVTASDSETVLKTKLYDLSSMYGSCIWNSRLCLWGAGGNVNNCLFLSEVDNFYYYPVPNNVVLFDTSVISCIPYKDTLLVFTADKIYQLSYSSDAQLQQTVIQNDMPLTLKDAAHLTAIKNMVLFKSGNYFYMMVPKTQSLTGELNIAPIYKNIAGLLNNLDNNILSVLQLMYPERQYITQSDETLPITVLNDGNPSDVYSEQDTVHILYDIEAYGSLINNGKVKETSTQYFKLFLNYNTNIRAWTMYLVDTKDDTLEVASLTASRIMSFVRIHKTSVNALNKAGTFSVVAQQYTDSIENGFRCLIDTGYRKLTNAIKKRFREIQIKLFSETENVTSFGTAFLVDGEFRRSYSKLKPTLTDDNKISLAPNIDINTFITELTMPVTESGDIIKAPGSDAIELSDWSLDFSHLKASAPKTIRIPVSGKGYTPRFILMAPNAINLYINEINWVYRLMNGR